MSQAQQAIAELLGRSSPFTGTDPRREDRRADRRVDIDPTSAWLGDLDRRHGERRQFSALPVAITGWSLL